LTPLLTAAQEKIITNDSTLVWLRRDLRLQDNAALYHALKENKHVLCVFIFDTTILEKLEDKADRRVDFIHQSLHTLKEQLENLGSSLLVLHGNPIDLYTKLQPKAVYTNHDYEPYALQRDENIRTLLEKRGIIFKTYKDQVIFEKEEVLKDDGKPYTVFTLQPQVESKIEFFLSKKLFHRKVLRSLSNAKALTNAFVGRNWFCENRCRVSRARY
jgi:deoxyribodipyrimidine photo-lyase